MPHLFEKVKNYIGDDSELKPYIPIIQEHLNQKVSRIINDPAQPRKISSTYSYQLTQVDEVKTSAKLCYNPMANWLIIWYFFVFQAIIFYFTQVTLVLTYGSIAWQAELSTLSVLALNLVYISVFIGDIYVQFNAGYITNSAIILNNKRVKYRYTHYYFYLDIILILAIIICLAVQTYELNYAKIIIVYKFLRMFEIDAIVIRKVYTWIQVRLVYEISKQFVTLYVLAQIWGIGFFLIDNHLLNEPVCVNNPSMCWLNSSTAWSPISGLPWNLQYFYTLYWGINTMCQISYGDIAPNNPFETPWALAGMCFGFVVYSYIVNNIVKAIIWANQKRDQFRVGLVLYDNYMAKLKLPMENQYEIVNFLKQRFKEENNRNLVTEDLMKSNLPEQLKIELTRSAYGHLAQGLDYFLGCEPAVTRMLFTIKEKKYSQDEKIIYQGAPVDELCFLHKGVIKISCEHMHQHYLISQMNHPDTFLTTYEFFLNQQSPISVTATENAVCYFIHKDSFEQQSRRDIQFKQSLQLLQYDLLIRKKIERIFYNCYFCRKRHHWYQCQESFPSFKKIDLSDMSNDEIYGRIRIVNTKHRTWKNYKQLSQLNRIVDRNKDWMLSRLETRIFALKKQLQLRKDILQVDVAYDWSSYLPDQNLQRFKEQWNGRITLRNRKTTQFNFKLDQ